MKRIDIGSLKSFPKVKQFKEMNGHPCKKLDETLIQNDRENQVGAK